MAGAHENAEAFKIELNRGIDLGMDVEMAILSQLHYGVLNEDLGYLEETLPAIQLELARMESMPELRSLACFLCVLNWIRAIGAMRPII